MNGIVGGGNSDWNAQVNDKRQRRWRCGLGMRHRRPPGGFTGSMPLAWSKFQERLVLVNIVAPMKSEGVGGNIDMGSSKTQKIIKRFLRKKWY